MVDNSAIILGFTGSIGSGCSYIAKEIPNITDKKYRYFKLSEIVRTQLVEAGFKSPTVEQMQQMGNELRIKFGRNGLAIGLIDRLKNDAEVYKHIIIDGIKNFGEIDFLRQFPNFYLFSVHADREQRKKRVVGRNKPFKTDDEFYAADARDEFEASSNGQQVKICSEASDIIIVNKEDIPEASTIRKTDYVTGIKRKYIELIENARAGTKSPQTTPSINELCMTIAYGLSTKSSCLKRKVGAVIIDTANHQSTEAVEEKAIKIPNIIASGYNEVPAGAYKCVFDKEYQKCYRDHLQETHAKKMKHCPNCGEEIVIDIACPGCGETHSEFEKNCKNCKTEIKEPYLCKGCSIDVFKEYLPGNKNTPGKLLDLCRALHAEEMAILQLAKRGGNGAGDLVLFATTQPCNLCANKIATAGIKTVVYAEPYDMKEAAEILKSGGVTLERFEGVKSSAYFKLYN